MIRIHITSVQRWKYMLFRGERAQKKCDFLVKIFQKAPKNAFSKFGLRRRKQVWPKQVFLMLWESSKINWVDLKEKVDTFWTFLVKVRSAIWIYGEFLNPNLIKLSENQCKSYFWRSFRIFFPYYSKKSSGNSWTLNHKAQSLQIDV